MAGLTAGVYPQRCAMPSPAELLVAVSVEADIELPEGVTGESIASFARHVLSSEGQSGAWQLGIRFVDDATMQQAHNEFLGLNTPTDIMTFPYDTPGFGGLPAVDDGLWDQGGDLLISVDRAEAHAEEEGWESSQEIFFLVCHGLLHILGWNDTTEEERMRMLGRQSSLLSDWVQH